MSLVLERQLVLLSVVLLAGAAVVQVAGVALGRNVYRPFAGIYAGVVAALTAAIIGRWLREGQGPFLTLYDILLSNLFSLALLFLVVTALVPTVRSGTLLASPLLLVLGVWLAGVSEIASPLPGAFDNPWLWVHVLSGKLFLGLNLSATAAASVMLLQTLLPSQRIAALTPNAERSEEMIWALFFVSFICHSVMLVAGAVWAHSAWGRYWSWDPLETWTLVTWLMLGGILHVRSTFRNMSRQAGHVLILVTFAVAFLTFFGVPFLSIAPHKGLM
jgi:ABC-type transport system involved in cytochrome c biogenesis permease subunit